MGVYSEQLFSTEGFSDDYSLLYHCHRPHRIKAEPQVDVSPQVAEEKCSKHRCFEGFHIAGRRVPAKPHTGAGEQRLSYCNWRPRRAETTGYLL